MDEHHFLFISVSVMAVSLRGSCAGWMKLNRKCCAYNLMVLYTVVKSGGSDKAEGADKI